MPMREWVRERVALDHQSSIFGRDLTGSSNAMDGGRKARLPAQRRILPHRVFVVDRARPAFSLVVPAFNEEHRLLQTLPVMYQFLESRFFGFELIVVDD